MLRIWVAALVTGWLALAGVASADTINVTRLDDSDTGSCPGSSCTLRHAIAVAGVGDTVLLGAGVHRLTQGNMIVLDQSLTIKGAGPGSTVIDGGQNFNAQFQPDRILKVTGGMASISDLTFRGGRDGRDENCMSGCSTLDANGGGALFNQDASVTLTRVAFDGNGGSGIGGAVSTSGGSLTLTDVDFNGNDAAYGGALFVRSGTVNGDRVTFRDGEATARGGAAYLFAGSLVLTNATVTGNGWASTIGGGIVNRNGTLELDGVTFAGNIRGALETDVGANTVVGNTIFGIAGYAVGANGACVGPGQSSDNTTTANPVTSDAGHNIAADASCGLAGNPVDPRLAPIGDNGGPTPTVALLHDSPAIDGGDLCAPTDQRGEARDGPCDIGAFEAKRLGAPAATTLPATVIGTGATLRASLNLAGEAGIVRFEYGTSPGELNDRLDVAAGVLGAQATRVGELGSLEPFTTYYYRARAINATGEAPGDVVQFTTGPNPPAVYDMAADEITDTSAKLTFIIDPQGGATSYRVRYNGQLTESVAIGATGPQELTYTLTGLAPATEYEVDVIATNSGGEGSYGGILLQTARRVTGASGAATTLVREVTSPSCPSQVTIDWGDGSPADGSAAVRCEFVVDWYEVTVTGTHVYAAPGHYRVALDYGTDTEVAWAAISAPPPPAATATPTATPVATVAQQPTPAPTPTAAPAPTPTFNQIVVVAPVSGKVLVKRRGARTFVALDAAAGIPLGSEVDLTKGKVKLTSVPKRGGTPESATFNGAIVRVTQSGGYTVLTLTGPPLDCRKRARSAAATKKVSKRRLFGDGKGRFRTKGQYGAATVRGTKWSVEDTCGATTFRVTQGSVAVRDNVKRTTTILRKGKRYTARARAR